MGGFGGTLFLRKLTLLPGKELEGFMETDTDCGGGEEMGLNQALPPPPLLHPWSKVDPEKTNWAHPHQPSLAPEEPSGDSSQFCRLRKGP